MIRKHWQFAGGPAIARDHSGSRKLKPANFLDLNFKHLVTGDFVCKLADLVHIQREICIRWHMAFSNEPIVSTPADYSDDSYNNQYNPLPTRHVASPIDVTSEI